MSGKTSLLNAVRWGLYGVAKDRAGKAMPVSKLINLEAYHEGTYRCAVSLHVLRPGDDGDDQIILKRQVQGRPRITKPSGDRDFSLHLDVTVNGDIRPESDYDDVVNELLPVEISRFFLFDGELLKEYEELVSEASTGRAKEVKAAIEAILGVPAATNGLSDFGELERETSRRYNREAAKDKDLEEKAAAADRLQAEQDDDEKERERLKATQREAHEAVQRADAELEKYRDLRDDAVKRVQLEKELKTRDSEDEQHRKERREHTKELWRDVLEPRLDHEVDRLESERAEVGVALVRRAAIERDKATYESTIEHSECVTCGQRLPEERLAQARARRDDLRDELARLDRDASQERQDELGATIKTLRTIAPAGVITAIEGLERSLEQSAVTKHRIRRELTSLAERLEQYDSAAVDHLERERAGYTRQITETETALSAVEEHLAQVSSDLKARQQAIKERNAPALRRLGHELELYEEAQRIFESTIDQLVEELRTEVERSASAIFRELTTDTAYKGLRINENYGLTIVDAEGTDVPVRSAGAEQVVALSLIGALNRLAARRGPVIMDTPFGRLDQKHRGKILRFLPTLADQVALLVHSGEIDPERDLSEIRSKVTSEFTIDHDSSTISKLRKSSS